MLALLLEPEPACLVIICQTQCVFRVPWPRETRVRCDRVQGAQSAFKRAFRQRMAAMFCRNASSGASLFLCQEQRARATAAKVSTPRYPKRYRKNLASRPSTPRHLTGVSLNDGSHVLPKCPRRAHGDSPRCTPRCARMQQGQPPVAQRLPYLNREGSTQSKREANLCEQIRAKGNVRWALARGVFLQREDAAQVASQRLGAASR